MSNYSDDDLDRALFALPLEEPPSDLRAAILSRTVYRAPAILRPWEVVTLGVIAAVIVWLVWMIAMGGFPLLSESLGKVVEVTQRSLSSVTVLAWLAAGGAAAVWLSLWANQPTPIRERTARH